MKTGSRAILQVSKYLALCIAIFMLSGAVFSHFGESPPVVANGMHLYHIAVSDLQGVRQISQTNDTYIEVLRRPQKRSWIRWPSGPEAYIFDANGILVDWTRDRGDDSRYVNRWGEFSSPTNFSILRSQSLWRVPTNN